MIREILINILFSAMGTISFAALFGVPKKYYVSCGITGILGWLTYMAAGQYTTTAVASFFATLVVVLFSRILTVKMKCPITVFLVSGIFPLVPGAGIYYTVYYLLTNQSRRAALQGMESVKIAFAIVLGIVIIVSIPREAFGLYYGRQRSAGEEEK